MIINILLPFYIVTWYNEIERIVVDVGIILYLKKYSFLKQKNSKIYIKIVLILYWYESEYDREGNSHNDKIWYFFQNSWYIYT